MKKIIILIVLCSTSFAGCKEPTEFLKQNGVEKMCDTESEMDLKADLIDPTNVLPKAPVRCEVELTNHDGWLYAAGGFLAATVVWGFYFYSKNKEQR